jgi:hypothetical protein
MKTTGILVTIMAAIAIVPSASAQETCVNGIRVEGAITDPTGAVIPGAQVQSTSGQRTTSDATGHYVLPCDPTTATTITVHADGFATGTVSVRVRQGAVARVNLKLALQSVQSDVQVQADDSSPGNDGGAGTTVLGSKEVQQLPDDPDDLLRVLQTLAVRCLQKAP